MPPRFAGRDEPEPVAGDADRIFDVETLHVRLADVGGMDDVKKRLEVAFLGPLRNPKLRQLYGKSLRGGLLLYGPPGCGKTFLARAVAGEMGAKFISLSIVDVLNMYIGNSEQNLHEIFETARRNAPVRAVPRRDRRARPQAQPDDVVGDAYPRQPAARPSSTAWTATTTASSCSPRRTRRGTSTPALRRPGRFDRMVLVLPPDAPARAAILEYHLRERPVAGIDVQAAGRGDRRLLRRRPRPPVRHARPSTRCTTRSAPARSA